MRGSEMAFSCADVKRAAQNGLAGPFLDAQDRSEVQRDSTRARLRETITMALRLQGKTALVTGATSNLGRAIALEYGAEGAHVVVSGRDQERGDAVVREIREGGGRADFVAADLDGTADASRALAEQATRVLGGRIDILVNNAGIYPGSTTASTDEETFDRVYAVNVKAPFFLTAAIAPVDGRSGTGAP
jgi:NAD(P)-dependent dehydrogenase (short-subunit alcohol dehydrogenase family)